MSIQSYIIDVLLTEFNYGLKVFLNYSVFEEICTHNFTLALNTLMKNPHQRKAKFP